MPWLYNHMDHLFTWSLSKLCVMNSSSRNCDVSVMTSWLAQKAAQKLRSKKSRRSSVHVFWGFLQGKRNCLCYYGLNFLPCSKHAQTPNLRNTPPEITMATFPMECTRLGFHYKREFRDSTIIIIVTECIVCSGPWPFNLSFCRSSSSFLFVFDWAKVSWP